MIGPIAAIAPSPLPEKPVPPSSAGPQGDFHSLLKSAIQSVEDARAASHASVSGFINGEAQDVHSVLLDVQRAELTFELFMQVRNKVTQAYQEIMRTQM